MFSCLGFPEVKKPRLTVGLVNREGESSDEEAVFRCEFDRLADLGVQYSVSFYGDDTLLATKSNVGENMAVLTEMEMDDLNYGSQVIENMGENSMLDMRIKSCVDMQTDVFRQTVQIYSMWLLVVLYR